LAGGCPREYSGDDGGTVDDPGGGMLGNRVGDRVRVIRSDERQMAWPVSSISAVFLAGRLDYGVGFRPLTRDAPLIEPAV
jgi:hypothetical protein